MFSQALESGMEVWELAPEERPLGFGEEEEGEGDQEPLTPEQNMRRTLSEEKVVEMEEKTGLAVPKHLVAMTDDGEVCTCFYTCLHLSTPVKSCACVYIPSLVLSCLLS